jgi:hypothetical protein
MAPNPNIYSLTFTLSYLFSLLLSYTLFITVLHIMYIT